MDKKPALKNYVVEFVKIKDVAPHENVDKLRAEKLACEIMSVGILRHPILVETRTNMILDGTHRHYIFKKIGIKYIPAIKVTYNDPRIVVGAWYRVYRKIRIDGIEKYGEIKMDDVIINDTLKNMDQSNSIHILNNRKNVRINLFKEIEIPDVIHYLDNLNKKYLIGYVPNVDVNPGNNYLIVYKPPSKNYIVKRFKEGQLFPVKYTRHIIPIKLPTVNIPLKSLSKHKI